MLVGLAERVTPLHTILPVIIKGVAGRDDGGKGRRRFKYSTLHCLRRGGEAIVDRLLRLGPLYVKSGR